MTYSHNSVCKNIKMTSAAAAAAINKTIRLKNGSSGGSNGGGCGSGGGQQQKPRQRKSSSSSPVSPPSAPSTPSTPTSAALPFFTTAHSNSIVSSTNFFQLDKVLRSSSPPRSSTSSCSTSSSYGSVGNFFAMRKQPQSQPQAQQRKSPQFFFGSSAPVNGAGGTYFPKNKRYSYHGGTVVTAGINGERHSPAANNSNHSLSTTSTPTSASASTSTTTSSKTSTKTSTPASNGFINNRQSLSNTVGSAVRKQLQLQQQQRSSKQSTNNSPQPLQFVSGGGGGVGGGNTGVGGGKSSPIQALAAATALTHFAGSKCFDAPSPLALPKPPEHWTFSDDVFNVQLQFTKKAETKSAGPRLQRAVSNISCRQAMKQLSSKRNLLDDFETHKLKLMLNVQS